MDHPALFFEEKNLPKLTHPSLAEPQYGRGIAFQVGDMFCALDLDINKKIILTENAGSQNLRDWVSKNFKDTKPVEAECLQGFRFKRIWRPYWPGPVFRAISQTNDSEKITESIVALRILLRKLEELFETIEPSVDNLSAYGHKIREILLLACMEVESSWAAVLKENGYLQTAPWKTADYVKLASPMLLDGYQLSLRSYPHFPAFSPFEGWSISSPTRSLEWYDAYNKTKHDREDNLSLATLNNAIQAVGAATVMFCAQFGFTFTVGFFDNIGPIVRSVFNIIPNFKKYEKAFYISPVQLQSEGVPTISFDWQSIDYRF